VPRTLPTKPALRAAALEARTQRAQPDISAARAAIRSLALNRAVRQGWQAVAGYRPLRTEPGSIELLDDLVDAGVEVLVPVLLSDRDLDWTRWPDASEQPLLGPDAVRAADAVLVPALAVDLTGVRLGRGGGSYDRALARVRSGTTTVALLFDGELVEALPTDPWDVPVQAALLPEGWHDLSG